MIVFACASVSTAQDLASLRKDLGSSSDFRVRVGAALALGKMHDRSSLAALVVALDDPSPAVRSAAAAALAVLDLSEASQALRARLERETLPGVRAQIERAIARLDARRASESGARILVKVGQLKNLTGARGERLAGAFRGATLAKAAELPGVEIIAEESEGRREAEARKLPLLVLDGVLNHLSQGAQGEQTIVSARVEYVFLKMPEHSLKGTMIGTARALESSKSAADQGRVAQLEMQALEGAIESAMRGAPAVMKQAIR